MPPFRGLVWAGNHQQYVAWLRSNQLDPNAFRYLHDIKDVLGVRDIPIVLVGTWSQSKHRWEIEEVIAENSLKVVFG